MDIAMDTMWLMFASIFGAVMFGIGYRFGEHHATVELWSYITAHSDDDDEDDDDLDFDEPSKDPRPPAHSRDLPGPDLTEVLKEPWPKVNSADWMAAKDSRESVTATAEPARKPEAFLVPVYVTDRAKVIKIMACWPIDSSARFVFIDDVSTLPGEVRRQLAHTMPDGPLLAIDCPSAEAGVALASLVALLAHIRTNPRHSLGTFLNCLHTNN